MRITFLGTLAANAYPEAFCRCANCDEGRVLATHIAHEGNPVHPELAAWAAGRGYEVAYDGLVV